MVKSIVKQDLEELPEKVLFAGFAAATVILKDFPGATQDHAKHLLTTAWQEIQESGVKTAGAEAVESMAQYMDLVYGSYCWNSDDNIFHVPQEQYRFACRSAAFNTIFILKQMLMAADE